MALQHTVSFLTAGPAFTFELPDDLYRRPQVTTPIDFDSGFGRSVTYLPYDGAEGFPPKFFRFVREIVGIGGPVLVFERYEDPLNWYLSWPLAQGSLASFMKEPEVRRGDDQLGLARAQIAADSLEIREYGGSAPMVVVHPPLTAVPSRLPGWGEYITFSKADGSKVLQLSRPGFIRGGRKRYEQSEVGNGIRYRGGTDIGVDVELQGAFDPEAGKVLLDSVSSAMTF